MGGYLNITVNDRDQSDPIKGARIKITEHNNSSVVLKEVVTDSSGQSNGIFLPSADNIRSEPAPYKKYDLIINIPPIPDRYSQPQEYIKSGVQIWPNKTTNNVDELVQINELLAISEQRPNKVIVIEDNNILLNEDKGIYQDPLAIPDPLPIGVPSGPSIDEVMPEIFLEREPFIPSSIQIYLGVANPYKKIWVNEKNVIKENYIKYLKMVSTQEFGGFKDFDSAAAVANLLLVNSVALNRVYTEVYVDKGYNFNITSTTAFDQHYPKGGTIFDHINEMVDKYFKYFIRVRGLKQPLLSLYCGLPSCKSGGIPQARISQSSKKPITEQEYETEKNISDPVLQKAKIILNRIYGAGRIELVAADIVEHIPKSFPGYVLRKGMSNEYVLMVQKELRVIRQIYDIIPDVEESGKFDEATFNAIVKFQNIKEKSKKEKGIVDEATWYVLSATYGQVSQAIEPIPLRAFIN